MQRRHALKDCEWEQIQDHLPGRFGTVGKPAQDNRQFVDAVLWIAKTGAPWRDLPERFGRWNSVWKRFRRWALDGIWEAVFRRLAIAADPEEMMLDATIVRAHQHAAGAKKKRAAAQKSKRDLEEAAEA
jgi:transposase